VERGERVVYMSMVPEAVIAMLACAARRRSQALFAGHVGLLPIG